VAGSTAIILEEIQGRGSAFTGLPARIFRFKPIGFSAAAIYSGAHQR